MPRPPNTFPPRGTSSIEPSVGASTEMTPFDHRDRDLDRTVGIHARHGLQQSLGDRRRQFGERDRTDHRFEWHREPVDLVGIVDREDQRCLHLELAQLEAECVAVAVDDTNTIAEAVEVGVEEVG